MEGLNGVIFVESIHYFPFILINLAAALQNIDRTMEESAQNLGCSGLRLYRRIVLPLAMPGYVAGVSLVFLKVFDDLGTPLLLKPFRRVERTDAIQEILARFPFSANKGGPHLAPAPVPMQEAEAS